MSAGFPSGPMLAGYLSRPPLSRVSIRSPCQQGFHPVPLLAGLQSGPPVNRIYIQASCWQCSCQQCFHPVSCQQYFLPGSCQQIFHLGACILTKEKEKTHRSVKPVLKPATSRLLSAVFLSEPPVGSVSIQAFCFHLGLLSTVFSSWPPVNNVFIQESCQQCFHSGFYRTSLNSSKKNTCSQTEETQSASALVTFHVIVSSVYQSFSFVKSFMWQRPKCYVKKAQNQMHISQGKCKGKEKMQAEV